MKAQKISPDFENSDDITARTIIRHAHRFTSAIDRVADVELRKKLDLSLSHVKIMIAIHKKLCCSQQDAASFWGITPAAISRQVSLLKKSGYVEEKLVGSKRAVLLTPSGKKKMEKGE